MSGPFNLQSGGQDLTRLLESLILGEDKEHPKMDDLANSILNLKNLCRLAGVGGIEGLGNEVARLSTVSLKGLLKNFRMFSLRAVPKS
jgi:hypothetical protein